MLKTISVCALMTCLVLAGAADTAYAQRPAPVFGSGGPAKKQTINFLVGGFFPKGLDSRADDDVLVGNSTFLCTSIDPDCVFDVGAFKTFTFGAEWLLPIGNFVEAGAGASYSKKTVSSAYADFLDNNGTPNFPDDDLEIEQELGLRTIPLAFTVRVLPFGQGSPVQPYVGGGINVFFWHYSETGDFIDFNQNPPAIFADDETYKQSGTTVGPVLLGGLRYASDAFTVGGEFRYQWAEGDLDPGLFAGSKIDLGGWTLHGTIGFRF